MLAFYVGKKPHLYTVYIEGSAIATPAFEHYASAGIGAPLASYLLKEYASEKSISDIAIAMSIFAVKKFKENTKFCGGETVVKRIAPLGQYTLEVQHIGKSERIPPDFVDLSEKRLVDFDERTKQSRNGEMLAILTDIGTALWKEYLKRVEAEEKAQIPNVQ